MCVLSVCGPRDVVLNFNWRARNQLHRKRKATRNAVVEYCLLIFLACCLFRFSSAPWGSLSDQCVAMRFAAVFVFAWVAFASGSTWQEPLLGAVKIPAAEINRLGKDAELLAHKAICCFFMVCACSCARGIAGVFGKCEIAQPRRCFRLPYLRRCGAHRFCKFW